MISNDKYTLSSKGTIFDALRKLEELSYESILAMFVIDDNCKVIGSITAGDVRRALLKGHGLDEKVDPVMNPNCKKTDQRKVF